jgi:hypothetical protein
MSAVSPLLLPQPGLAQNSFLSAPGTAHLVVPPTTFIQTELNLLLGISVWEATQESPECLNNKSFGKNLTMCSFLQRFDIHVEANMTTN